MGTGDQDPRVAQSIPEGAARWQSRQGPGTSEGCSPGATGAPPEEGALARGCFCPHFHARRGEHPASRRRDTRAPCALGAFVQVGAWEIPQRSPSPRGMLAPARAGPSAGPKAQGRQRRVDSRTRTCRTQRGSGSLEIPPGRKGSVERGAGVRAAEGDTVREGGGDGPPPQSPTDPLSASTAPSVAPAGCHGRPRCAPRELTPPPESLGLEVPGASQHPLQSTMQEGRAEGSGGENPARFTGEGVGHD